MGLGRSAAPLATGADSAQREKSGCTTFRSSGGIDLASLTDGPCPRGSEAAGRGGCRSLFSSDAAGWPTVDSATDKGGDAAVEVAS